MSIFKAVLGRDPSHSVDVMSESALSKDLNLQHKPEKCLISVEQLVSEFMNLLGIFKNLVFRSKNQKHLARGLLEASYTSFKQEDIIVKQDPIMYFGDM